MVGRTCANGCTNDGEGLTTLAVAVHGNYCDRCFGRLDNAIRRAPRLVGHVISLVSYRGSQTDDRVDTSNVAPLPFNVQAFHDANEIYQRFVYWAKTWADQLGIDAPAAARRAWRASDGFIVGLPDCITADEATDVTHMMATWLSTNLDGILTVGSVDDVAYFRDELKDVYRINARWPREDQARYSPIPCADDDCGARIAIFPPSDFEKDQIIQCEKCGRTYSDEDYRWLLGQWKEKKQAIAADYTRAAKVMARLSKKYGVAG